MVYLVVLSIFSLLRSFSDVTDTKSENFKQRGPSKRKQNFETQRSSNKEKCQGFRLNISKWLFSSYFLIHSKQVLFWGIWSSGSGKKVNQITWFFSLTSRSFVMFEPEQRPDEQRAQVELNQQRRGQRHQERRLRAVPQGQHQRDSTEMRHSWWRSDVANGWREEWDHQVCDDINLPSRFITKHEMTSLIFW